MQSLLHSPFVTALIGLVAGYIASLVFESALHGANRTTSGIVGTLIVTNCLLGGILGVLILGVLLFQAPQAMH